MPKNLSLRFINQQSFDIFPLQVIILMQSFCYWDAKSRTDTLIIIVNQTIVTTLLIIAILRLIVLCRLKVDLSIDIRTIRSIHIFVICWGLVQLIINYYSIGVFFGLPEEVTNQDMLPHSHFYAIASAFPGYLVQTLFITICFTFCNNLVRETDIRRFPNYSIKFVFALRVYYWYRLAVWFVAVVLICIATKTSVKSSSTAEFLSLIVDSFVINVFLMLALRIFINRLRDQSFLPLRREYKLMFFFSLSRIVVDCLYLALAEADHGYCVSQKQYSVMYTILYNMIGNWLLHFAPIIVVLLIYRFDYREVQEGSQLLPRFSRTTTHY